MSVTVELIQGGQHKDHRGMITFLNDFDMNEVKRFYIIQNEDIETVRAWRAHRDEQRWFYVSDGEFLIRLVKIDNWESPDKGLPIENIILSEKKTRFYISRKVMVAGYRLLRAIPNYLFLPIMESTMQNATITCIH